MDDHKMNVPNTEGLETLVERLEQSYYNAITTLCDTAKKQAQKLQELEARPIASQYVTLCTRLIEEVQYYISIKKEYSVPYLHSLSEKDAEGHDCKNCTGSGTCNAQHDMQLMELKNAHMKLKDIIYRVQIVALPLYSETMYPDVYRILRNYMGFLEHKLTELFLLEDAQLIPKVAEAQKNINAGN